jgi:predicted RecB family nuclease
VHESDAPELEPDIALEDLFEQGRQVGKLARDYVPGGVLIDLPYRDFEGRVRATDEALAAGAPVVYEAAFIADGVFVAVDILERTEDGFTLIEVKSATSAKDDYIPDIAVQTHALRSCGLDVGRQELMHLNRECRYPDLSNLFVRTDMTAQVAEFLPQVPGEIEAQLGMLDGPFPDGGFGEHCLTSKDCPFHDRCWPELSPEHVLTLYRLSPEKKLALLDHGIESIHDLETTQSLSKLAQRQVRSVRAGGRIVSKGLAKALEPFEGWLAYLDFETVSLAIPVWEGCGPWGKMPVQFSVHKENHPGWPEHHEFLAADGEDCREEMARALTEACEGADAIVAYNAGFEKACVGLLAEAAPELAGELEEIKSKLVDLLPVVRNYVYDPEFMGSFSLKSVLPAMLPDLGYDDLEIAEGMTASLYLARLLFRPETVEEEEREPLREKLLEYCKRDTWATVRLLGKLREMAA